MNTRPISLTNLMNANVTTTGDSSTAMDVSKFIGNAFLNVSSRASGTNVATVTVEHSEASGSGFSPVPAGALLNPETGAPATFADIAATAVNTTLQLEVTRCKRYVRVTFAGTSLDHNIAVSATAERQYS